MVNTKELDKCVLCQNSSYISILIKHGRPIVECRSCGLVFVSPQPSRKEIDDQYILDDTSPSDYYGKSAKIDRLVFNKRLELIEEFSTKRSILDVGCSVGEFLLAAKDRDWSVIKGIEPNKNAAEICLAKGLDVQNTFFSPDEIEDNEKVEVIHMGDVIEHFSNPRDAVILAKSLLISGGSLVLVTPDFDSRVARALQIKPLEHLFYFTESTLTKMMVDAGFKIRLIKKTTRRRDIDSLKFGTTFSSPLVKFVLDLLSFTRLSLPLGWLLEKVLRDEIILVAEKT